MSGSTSSPSPAASTPPLLVTPEEAARQLGVGRTTVCELMAAGKLPSMKIGRARRVPVEALQRFIAAHLDGGGDDR
jgi:excisionase family DNA binding protein